MFSKVILDKLTIHEFCGITGEMSVSLSRGITEFIGDNGKGKSSIINAFAWLLTGKDAFGETREPFVNNGNKEAFCFVEAEIFVGDETILLKRCMQRSNTGKKSTTLWKNHEIIKEAQWKANFDPDICLMVINPKYLSSLSSKDMKKVLSKFLKLKKSDVGDIINDTLLDLDGDELDIFSELVDLYNNVHDLDEVADILDDDTKELKDSIKVKEAFCKDFLKLKDAPVVPFVYKMGETVFFDEASALDAVKNALKDNFEANFHYVEEYSEAVAKNALNNKVHLDYLEAEKKNNAYRKEIDEVNKRIDVFKRQKDYIDMINVKLLETINSTLSGTDITFQFKDIFDKKDFAIYYQGKKLDDCSYAEQVNAGILLADSFMQYIGISYPMFIDNAECITSLPKFSDKRQIVSMQVAKGYDLSYYEENAIINVYTMETLPKVEDKHSLIVTRLVGGSFDVAE